MVRVRVPSPRSRRLRGRPWAVVVLALLGLLYLVPRVALQLRTPEAAVAAEDPPALDGTSQQAPSVEELFASRRSGVMVEVAGTVDRLLPDDREGSPHQRFIVVLGSGHTLLVAHNLDLAPRLPLAPGDALELRGQYEWNERGGVLHWTHRDPHKRREGGWIRLRGEVYR